MSDIKFVETEEKEKLLDDRVFSEEEFEKLSRKEKTSIFDEIRKNNKEGVLSNTPSSNSKNEGFRHKTTKKEVKKGLKIVNKGLDYLKIGFYGTIPEYTMMKLNREQMTAQAHRGTKKVRTKKLKGYNFKFLPNGSSNYSFLLINDLIRIYIGQISKEMNKETGEVKYHYPNIMIDMQSVILNQLGVEKAYNLACSIAEEFVYEIEKEKVSRIDIFADIHGAHSELSKESIHSNFMCRSVNNHPIYQHNGVSGHNFGSRSSKIYGRIYNKSKEISYKGGQKDWFYDLWNVEKDQSNAVWRAEFQLGRKFFSDFYYKKDGQKTNIETFEDVQNSMLSIWKYITQKWIRLCYDDNKKATRRTVYPLWKVFQNIDSMEGNTVNPEIIRGKTSFGKRKQYIQNAAGNITSIVASSLGNINVDEIGIKGSNANEVIQKELEKALNEVEGEIRKKIYDDIVKKIHDNQVQV